MTDEIEKAIQEAYEKQGYTQPDTAYNIFRAGYRAALAANTWVAINSVDDLPKEGGQYLVTRKFGLDGFEFQSLVEIARFQVSEEAYVGSWINTYSAWRSLPQPYTPEAK